MRRRPSGFTLPELMAVITLLGLLAAVGMAKLGSKGRQAMSARSLAERLSSELEQARVRALTTRQSQRVTLGPTGATVQAQNPTTLAWTTVSQVLEPNGEARVWDVKYTPVAPTAPAGASHSVQFAPDFTVSVDGGASVNAHVYVAGVQDAKVGRQFHIVVLGTGAVRLYEGW